jgi:hypothetical protein
VTGFQTFALPISIYSFDSRSNSITRLANLNVTNVRNPAGPGGIFYGTGGGGGAIYSFEVSAAPVPGPLPPAPGPLPILGVGAAFGYSRKLRKRIKNAKPEAISTNAV